MPVTGGSNLVMCELPGLHGYVRQFDVHQSAIVGQLTQMWNNGQRRMSLAIPFFEGGDGFALDSSTGALTPKDKANLLGMLNLLKSLGFFHVMIEMIPEWNSALENWPSSAIMQALGAGIWRPVEYARNFTFTCDVWETVRSVFNSDQCGIDIHAEAVQPDWITSQAQNAVWLKYTNRLWDDWLAQFGVSGTIGFSLIPTPDRVANIKATYGNGVYPYVWAYHLYGGYPNIPGYDTTANVNKNFNQAMIDAGYSGPTWGGKIVTECFCDDAETAQVIAADPSIFWLTQWGVGRDTPVGVTQDRLTTAYDKYQAANL